MLPGVVPSVSDHIQIHITQNVPDTIYYLSLPVTPEIVTFGVEGAH
jgi:hypothetical protein